MPLLACEEEANQGVNTAQTQQAFFRYCKLIEQIFLCSHCDCVTLGNAVSICCFTLLYMVSLSLFVWRLAFPCMEVVSRNFFFL